MPFMEYAGSYALYNYKLEDPSKGMEYDNIRLIRAFEHGLDPKSSVSGQLSLYDTCVVSDIVTSSYIQFRNSLTMEPNRKQDSSSSTLTWSRTLDLLSLVSSKLSKLLMRAVRLPTMPCGKCSVP